MRKLLTIAAIAAVLAGVPIWAAEIQPVPTIPVAGSLMKVVEATGKLDQFDFVAVTLLTVAENVRPSMIRLQLEPTGILPEGSTRSTPALDFRIVDSQPIACGKLRRTARATTGSTLSGEYRWVEVNLDETQPGKCSNGETGNPTWTVSVNAQEGGYVKSRLIAEGVAEYRGAAE